MQPGAFTMIAPGFVFLEQSQTLRFYLCSKPGLKARYFV
jgi:hypothetical protein